RRRGGTQPHREPIAAPATAAGDPPTPGPHRGERDAGAATLRPVRVPGARRDRVAVRAPGLRPVGGARPHVRAQAGRGEVEPAHADRAGRGGGLAARCAGPDRATGLPRPPVAARARPEVGYLVTPATGPTSRSAV